MKHNLKPNQWLKWFLYLVLGLVLEFVAVGNGTPNDTLSPFK